MLGLDSGNQVENNAVVDEKIAYTIVHRKVVMRSLDHNEEKEMTKLLHIIIQVKKTKVDAIYDSCSEAKITVEDLVNNFGLEVGDHPSPYLLRWVNKDVELRVTKLCKIKFSFTTDFINEGG
jgi:hypothetical protein